ncbi:MAG: glycosyltransferase family 4 protein [Oceanospirillaceae bacterium]|nr:glycosyltransferase family 4 protein [Oceanospirillaceae bacterium]
MKIPRTDPEVLVFSLKSRYTGVSATVNALVPLQVKEWRLEYVGPKMPNGIEPISVMKALKISLRPPKDRPFRIWHLRRNNEMLLGVIARDLFRLPIKLVFTSAAQRRHSALPRWLISKMNAVICTSEAAAEFVPNVSAVVPHGIDTKRFPAPLNKEVAWRDSGLPGKWGIGIFGRVRPEKGTDIFVDAMIQVLPKFPDFTAVIAGLVQPKFESFYAELKSKIASAGLSDRIVFLGEIPSDQIHLWYQRCLICVACPRYEAFGLTLFEAASSECAVIGSRTGAFSELALDGQTGALMTATDLASLTCSLEPLIKNPELAEDFGKRARALVKAKFSVDTESAGIGKVYEALFAVN